MKVTIVYDNCCAETGLLTNWGFSCLIETDRAPPLLFDTGADGATLLHNMKRLGIDPACLAAVVISHGHADHVGGLADLLALNEQARIYIPASMKARIPGHEVIRVSKPLQISEDVFSTGELGGIEQSLAVKTSGGMLVVTGCSHPGVGAILKAASGCGRVCAITGGLHGFDDFSQMESLSLICPCHCTRYKEELARRFPQQYVRCGAGLTLEMQ